MSAADQFMLALTAWRENRGGGRAGMQSVINVVLNRAKRRNTTPYEECVRPWQFSSITAKDDPQLANWPTPERAEDWQRWHEAQNLAAEGDGLNDITDGATNYYALSMAEPPPWAVAMTPTVDIEGQRFLK